MVNLAPDELLYAGNLASEIACALSFRSLWLSTRINSGDQKIPVQASFEVENRSSKASAASSLKYSGIPALQAEPVKYWVINRYTFRQPAKAGFLFALFKSNAYAWVIS